jgi:uncharacterized protein
MNDSSSPLGRVVATERKPNTPHEFHFWTSLDSPVGIGTIVRVDGPVPVNGVIPRIYGTVIEGFSYTDLQTPLHDVLGSDGSPANAGRAPTARTEIRLYTAAVLRHIPEDPLQPVPMGEVHLADENDVAIALRMDGYLKEGSRTGIPIGVYRSGGTEAPIYLDADFLLGPEAAHLNITGVSGLATKTSAVEWMLSSIFTHFPESKGSVAAVAFNVKGPDLCFLDQPGPIDDADREIYERCQVPAEPFEKVKYFAPYKSDGVSINTLRSNEALQDNVAPLTWGLREVLQYAEVLLNKDDVDAKADALIDFIRERVVDREFRDELLGVVQGRAFRRGTEQQGKLAYAPRGDDPQSAEPAGQHLHALRRLGDRFRRRQRPAVRQLRGPHGVCGGRRVARGRRAGPHLRSYRHQAPRAPREARPRSESRRAVRGRAQQVRAR